MGKMVPRIILGGVVAGILCFIGDGVVHGVLLHERWDSDGDLRSNGDRGHRGMAEWLLYDPPRGWSEWLYAAIRPRSALVRGPERRRGVTWARCPHRLAWLLPATFIGHRFAAIWSIEGLVVC